VTRNLALLSTLERRNRELEVLIEIGKALTSTLDLEGVLNLIMDQLNRLLNAQAWSLLLRDAESGVLTCAMAVAPSGKSRKGRQSVCGKGVASWVAEHDQPLLIPDLGQEPPIAGIDDWGTVYSAGSVLCVPVKSRDRVLGIIELSNGPQKKAFTKSDLQILLTIADYAAIAIENARNFERISELAITDELTGLYNSRHLHTLLDEEIARMERFGGKLSLIFIDLDFFKRVNDTRGHLIGSRTLAEIGQLIRGNIRKVCKAARYGGDEFVIILPSTGKSGAMALATRLRELFREYEFRDECGSTFNLTASFGLAVYPDDAGSKDELIRMADQAMYRVKESTRDSVQSA
jgi:diguanylate cyclase (GGDEF)-like protein